MRLIDTLRALVVATNSMRYNPELDPDVAIAYEQILTNLRDELCQENAEPPNPPLTLEELREMDGEPVWISGKDIGCYDVCCGISTDGIVQFYKAALHADSYGKTWLAYRRKPEEGTTWQQ